VRRVFRVHLVGDHAYVDSPLGNSDLRVLPRFAAAEEVAEAGSLVAPLPGVVNEVRVQPGEMVEAGQVLLVIESMKMLHSINAPVAGRVSQLYVQPASQVHAGLVLAVIEEAESAQAN
jgi:biotin carboxyl carrier protein